MVYAATDVTEMRSSAHHSLPDMPSLGSTITARPDSARKMHVNSDVVAVWPIFGPAVLQMNMSSSKIIRVRLAAFHQY